MLKSSQIRKPSAVVIAAILATGALAAWMFASGLLVSMVYQWTRSPIYETFFISRSGQVLVMQYQLDKGSRSFRTLEGEPVAVVKNVDNAYGINLSARHDTRAIGTDWYERIAGFFDTENPTNFWYLCHNGKPQGQAYFIGFNSATLQPTGFIGTGGFRNYIPSEDEQFAINVKQFTDRAAFSCAIYPRIGQRPFAFSIDNAWLVYVSADDKLWIADLNRRSVQAVDLPEDVITAQTADEPSRSEGNGTLSRLLVRTPQKILVLSLDGKIVSQFVIPEALRTKSIRFLNWWTAAPVMIHQGWRRGETSTVCLLDAQGKVAKQFEAELIPPPDEFHWEPWSAPIALPSPLPAAYVLFVEIPRRKVFVESLPDYPTAVRQVAPAALPALGAVCLLSIVSAVFCYRHHRRYSRRGAAGWALFVLITGAPGLVGYLLHRRWPVIERCPQCGNETPLDRDACLSCAAEFAPPALKGIEVFA